jgi:hypothetical protein
MPFVNIQHSIDLYKSMITTSVVSVTGMAQVWACYPTIHSTDFDSKNSLQKIFH